MGRQSIWEYLRTVYARYRRAANRRTKQKMLDEFCANTGYHRKHALRLLNGPPPSGARSRPAHPVRRPTYGKELVSVLKATWQAAGYPLVGAAEGPDPPVDALGAKAFSAQRRGGAPT